MPTSVHKTPTAASIVRRILDSLSGMGTTAAFAKEPGALAKICREYGVSLNYFFDKRSGHVRRISDLGGQKLVRKIGQIVRRGPSTWLVRIYVGRDPETRRRKYVGKFTHGGLRSAQAYLNRMLAERDLVATSVLPDKPSVSIWITGSTMCQAKAASKKLSRLRRLLSVI